MPVTMYETLLLLEATKLSTDADGMKQQLHTIIERNGGTIAISRPWDYNHKLTYAIEKQKKGTFHIIYYTLESTKQVVLERDFALAEGVILRQMTLRIDPKWQEAILTVAREDSNNGFAVRGMQEEVSVTTDPNAIGGDPMMMGMGMGMDDMGGGGRGDRRGGRRYEGSDKPE